MPVLIADRKERLDQFLARSFPEHSRTKLAKLIDQGEVTVDGNVEKPRFMLEAGMEVVMATPGESAPHDLTPAEIPLDVVFEDDQFMVINKPRGLAVHPAASLNEPSLVNALLGRGGPLSSAAGSFRPGIVHRLDRDTTGLIVVAKTDAAHAHLAKQIETKHAERRYFAVVAGAFDQAKFTIDAPIGRDPNVRQRMAVNAKGKSAVTHVRVVTRLERGTLLAVTLETGRTHQIRVHLRAIGHPVLGDTTYAPKEYHSYPLQLHAAYLAVDHPVTGARMHWFAAPPADFIAAEFATPESI